MIQIVIAKNNHLFKLEICDRNSIQKINILKRFDVFQIAIANNLYKTKSTIFTCLIYAKNRQTQWSDRFSITTYYKEIFWITSLFLRVRSISTPTKNSRYHTTIRVCKNTVKIESNMSQYFNHNLIRCNKNCAIWFEQIYNVC